MKKGKYIENTSLKMTDYLLPECELGTEKKFTIFLRTKINDIPKNVHANNFVNWDGHNQYWILNTFLLLKNQCQEIF